MFGEALVHCPAMLAEQLLLLRIPAQPLPLSLRLSVPPSLLRGRAVFDVLQCLELLLDLLLVLLQLPCLLGLPSFLQCSLLVQPLLLLACLCFLPLQQLAGLQGLPLLHGLLLPLLPVEQLRLLLLLPQRMLLL